MHMEMCGEQECIAVATGSLRAENILIKVIISH